jgi:hypothetical protein
MSDTTLPADGTNPQGTPAADGGNGADPGTGQTATPYLHTFRDRDEAEKGWKEAQSALTKAQQEAAEAKREAEMARIAKEAAEAKAMAGARLETDEKAQAQRDREAWLARLRTNGEEGVLDFMESAYAQTQAELAKIRQAHAEELQRLRAEVSTVKETSDTFYQANRDSIDELVSGYGMTRSAAVKLFRDKLNKASVAPGSPAPGALPNSVTRPAQGGAQKRTWTADERAKMRDMGMSDKEIDE